MDTVQIIIQALERITIQLVELLPKLIFALIIWYIGKYLLALTLALIKKLDTKSENDKKSLNLAAGLVDIIGRAVLVLVILDYLGIGKTLIGAITQGFSLAIGISLGIAFGKALEDDAKKVLNSIKTLFGD